ncbi:MAG: DNA internalization-related competence protein ComEC/Rec2 [Clostridia bacterium]|nr:DNA internalization-related competence protein ComEC/Rec2 [Clostridia bacterium]
MVGYDYANYLYSQGIYGTIYVDKYDEIGVRYNFINQIRHNILDVLGKLFPKEESGLIIGMLIGDTTYLSDDTIKSFKDSGISHLLAVSGSNVAFIVLMTKFVFDKIFGKSISNYLSIITIIIFVFVSGCSLSVIRAGVMAIIIILYNLIMHREDIIVSISLSCLLILLFNPFSICDVGFILSYGGTIGIVILYKPIKMFFISKVDNLKHKNILENIIDVFSVTLSAQIILIPIINYFFNTFSIISFLTNLLVSPFVGIVTIYGFIIYIIGLVSIEIARFLSFPLYVVVKLVILISKICSNIPFANITTPTISILSIIIYYLIVIYIFGKKSRLFKYSIIILIALQIIIIVLPKSYVEMHMIDVGQGDSILITTSHRKNILIDGGGSENSDYDVGENVLVPYLLDNTNGRIDTIFITHFHEDHAEGIISVLNNLNVNRIIIGNQPAESDLYNEIFKIAKEKSIEVTTLYSKDKFMIDEVTFTILYPPKTLDTTDFNNSSLIIRVDAFDTSILLTGDAEFVEEDELLDYYRNNSILDCDILKVGHHGSKTSSSDEFLKAITPNICLISCGVNNKFKHPHQEALERLNKFTNKIFRTDISGEISLKVYKNKIVVNTQL